MKIIPEHYKPISQESDPVKISNIIMEQVERERMVRITEGISHSKSTVIPADKFLNSKLVNRQRTFGCD